MRSSLQTLYDDFYYGFEKFYNNAFLRFKTWKKYLGVKFDKELYTAYKKTIVPYWAKYGIKPSLCMVKENYVLSAGSLDPRNIPDDIWLNKVVPYFNDSRFSRVLADKNLNNLLFPDVKRPKTLIKSVSGRYCLDDFTPISRDDAIGLCRSEGRWVIKPTINSFQGQDVRIFNGPLSQEEVEKLFSIYESTDFIVQEAIVQHPAISAYNPSSVNTLRLITLVFREQAYILSSVLRVGAPGSIVDNTGAGGYAFDITPSGSISTIAYSSRNGEVRHDDRSSDPAYCNNHIPNYAKICNMAKEMAKRVPHLSLIAWDFAIDPEGEAILLEFNTHSPGQNQETSGPSFGALTEDVLTEVFLNRKKK